VGHAQRSLKPSKENIQHGTQETQTTALSRQQQNQQQQNIMGSNISREAGNSSSNN
jgi:hypothetical protein